MAFADKGLLNSLLLLSMGGVSAIVIYKSLQENKEISLLRK